METEIAGWLGIVFRLVHVIAAIMWIGNSLLFTWMELNLIPPADDKQRERPDLLGHLDMLHGGGVFHLEKRLIDPKRIPIPLHWFMWQSYTTWISGALLIISVFYINGGAPLLDATKTSISGHLAILFSVTGLIGGWVVYDLIWRSPLKENKALVFPLSLLLLIAAAWFFNQHFNGRAVYLQIGAMMGTFMSANVFFHIIRNQKRFMASLEAGHPPDPNHGKQAKLRSMHNHYMTFPVIFLMLSAHFPQLTSAHHNIPVLAVIVLALAAIKYLMNSRYHFRHWLAAIFATFILASGTIAALVSVEKPFPPGADPAISQGAALFLSQGCAACHQQGSDQLAPLLEGIHNSTRILADGTTILADEPYLRTSITQPQLHLVKGYPPAMPPYAHLPPEQIDELIAYLKSL